MPALMVVAEWRWQRDNDPIVLELAKRWAKGTAILFAVGDFGDVRRRVSW